SYECALLGAGGWWRDGRRSADAVVLNLIAVERKIALEDNIQRRAARKLGFGPSCQQNCAEPGEAADTRSNAGAFCAASDGADTGSGCGCCGDGFRVLPFSTATDGFAFVVHRFGSTGVGAARVGLEVDSVPVRENQRVELHTKFAATFNATGT